MRLTESPWAVLAAFIALVLGGCGTRPAVDTMSPLPERSFPAARYLTAEGLSDVGFSDAEQRARGALAAQIRSSLESQVTMIVTSSERDGIESLAKDFEQVIRQQAVFSRAELIRIDTAGRRLQDGIYTVRAYLSRSEAAAALQRDFDIALASFRRDGQAVLGVADGDLPGLAAAMHAARRSGNTALQQALELRTIAGSYPTGLDEADALWQAVQDRRVRDLGLMHLVLDLLPADAGTASIDLSYLRQEFIRALSSLGLAVRGTACGDTSYRIELRPRLVERTIFGIPHCRVEFTGSLLDCAADVAWDLQISDAALSAHGNTRDRARSRAVAEVTAARLQVALAEGLAGVVPLD